MGRSRVSDARRPIPVSSLQAPLAPGARQRVGRQRRTLACWRPAGRILPIPSLARAQTHGWHIHAGGRAQLGLVLVAAAGADVAALRLIEAAVPTDCSGAARPCLTISGSNGSNVANAGAPTAGGYRVTVTAKTTGNTFSIDRASNGTISYVCTGTGGGCPTGGAWN